MRSTMRSMRIVFLAAVALLAVVASGGAGTRMSTVEYTPPPQPGDIYTVIDFARSGGTAEATTIEEVMGSRRREMTVVPHDYCEHTTPAGVVVRFRHYTADSVPLTVTTSGKIVHPPHQGGMPIEAMHRCYQLMS
ncbi:MAG: hypothetical protein JOZ15_14555 [Acidobacteria bacterium]|nr:hypothetical protein [Acidobacteriota bacterium]